MKTDVLIIGGGPGGSAAAMFLLKEGIKPIILEQEKFPRFHIGESMTGEAAAVLRRLGLADEMMARRYPVKHGVRVYGKDGNNSWFIPVAARDANWELQNGSTWQVRRSDFDGMMIDTAAKRGAQLVHGSAVKALLGEDGGVRGVTMRHPDGRMEDIEATVVLDCSGMATFLGNQKITGPKYVGAYDKQIAFFAHVRGALRDEGTEGETAPGNTIIFYEKKYHWSWFIPVDDEVTSLGLVVPRAKFQESGQTPQEFFLDYLPQINPDLARRIAGYEVIDKVHVIPNYSYQVRRFCGKGFICIGDAHRFIDPIFSFGLSATMREAEFAIPHVISYLRGERREDENPFAEHMLFCEQGIDCLEDMVDLFWEQPFAFATFVHARYRSDLIDAFAGRIYRTEHQPSPAIQTFRKLLKREREYEHEDDYSIPIGSRYHPERAALWAPDSPVESTEEWLSSNLAEA
ncbi:MAG: tryptophan 7-halogenase [Verrucomicrobiota bacterium]|nr:tryptophan 7-halogenase [Verrucomicrobiota bacterium]